MPGSSTGTETIASETGRAVTRVNRVGQPIPLDGTHGADYTAGAGDSTFGQLTQATERVSPPSPSQEEIAFDLAVEGYVDPAQRQGMPVPQYGMGGCAVPGFGQDAMLQADGSMGTGLQQGSDLMPWDGIWRGDAAGAGYGAIDPVAAPAWMWQQQGVPDVPLNGNGTFDFAGVNAGAFDQGAGAMDMAQQPVPDMSHGMQDANGANRVTIDLTADDAGVGQQQFPDIPLNGMQGPDLAGAEYGAMNTVAGPTQRGQQQWPAMPLNGAAGFDAPGANFQYPGMSLNGMQDPQVAAGGDGIGFVQQAGAAEMAQQQVPGMPYYNMQGPKAAAGGDGDGFDQHAGVAEMAQLQVPGMPLNGTQDPQVATGGNGSGFVQQTGAAEMAHQQVPGMPFNGMQGFYPAGDDQGAMNPAAGALGMAHQQPLPQGPPAYVPMPPTQGGQALDGPPMPAGAAAGKGKRTRKAKQPAAQIGEDGKRVKKPPVALKAGRSGRRDKSGFDVKVKATGEDVPGNERGQVTGWPSLLRHHVRRCSPMTGCDRSCDMQARFPHVWAIRSQQVWMRVNADASVDLKDGTFHMTGDGFTEVAT